MYGLSFKYDEDIPKDQSLPNGDALSSQKPKYFQIVML